MAVTREEKIYRSKVEGRLSTLEDGKFTPGSVAKQTPQLIENSNERISTIEQVLGIPGGQDPDDQSVDIVSGWRHWVESKLSPLFRVGDWVDETHLRLTNLESGKTPSDRQLESFKSRLRGLEELRIKYRLKPLEELHHFLKTHQLDSEMIGMLESKWKEYKRKFDERYKDLENLGREHELELFGPEGEEADNGLTSRIHKAEEAIDIISSELWWIRKGVLILLLLSIWVLIDIWRMAGWWTPL